MAFCAFSSFSVCHWNVWLWYVIASFQIIFGTLGNILNMFVLSRKRIRKYSTTVYLMFLAGADIATLWTSILPNFLLSVLDVNIWSYSQVLCKCISWINHASASFSVWLLVLLTVERVLLTKYPVYSRSKLSRTSSFVASLVLLFVLVILCSHYLFGMTIQYRTVQKGSTNVSVYMCLPSSEEYKQFFSTTWALIVLFVLNVIPVVLVIFGNSLILWTMCIQNRRLSKVNPSSELQRTNFRNKTKSSTKMIFLINGLFVFTTLPYTINRALVVKRSVNGDHDQAKYILIDSLFVLLLYCNFTFNFLIYFVGGTLFAQELKILLKEISYKFQNSVCRLPYKGEIRRATNTNAVRTNYDTGM